MRLATYRISQVEGKGYGKRGKGKENGDRPPISA